jgi:hypothetical protein
LQSPLQIGEHPFDRSRPRIAAVAKVEHESRVAHRFAAEAGWGSVAVTKKLSE